MLLAANGQYLISLYWRSFCGPREHRPSPISWPDSAKGA